MPGMKRAALVLIGVLLSVRAFAAEPAASDAEAADPRLQAKISFSSPAAPLPGMLAFLSDASGVEFSVYSSRESWWIKELTVCMSAKDLPLWRIRAGLSDLLNLRWARYGKEPRWSYALWQDRRTREKDEAELADAHARALVPVRDGVRSIADFARSAASVSSSERDSAAARDPVAKFLTSDPFGKSYAGLMSALDPVIQSAQSSPLSSGVLELPFTSLSAPQRAAVREFVKQAAMLEERVDGRRSSGGTTDWDSVAIQIARTPEGRGVPAQSIFGEMDMQGVSGMHDFPLMALDSPVLKLFAAYIPRLTAGEDPQALSRELEEAFGANLEKLETPEAAKPPPWMSAPELQKKIRLTMKPDQTLPDLLQGVSELSGIPVFAECWDTSSLGISGEEERTVAETLKVILQRSNMTCEYRRGALLVTAPDRIVRRSGMVPRAEVDALVKRSKSQRGLKAADLAGILGAYRDEQILTLMKKPELRFDLRVLGSSATRAALAFYGALSDGDRVGMASAGGIAAQSLSEAAWNLLAAAVRGSNAPADWLAGPALRVRYVNHAASNAPGGSKLEPGEWLIFSRGEGEERTVQLARLLPPEPTPVPAPKSE